MTRQEYKDIYDVVGVAQEVHSTLGRGMHERVYQEALAVEMKQRGMDFEREKHLNVIYKGVQLDMTYIADFYYKGSTRQYWWFGLTAASGCRIPPSSALYSHHRSEANSHQASMCR